MTTCKNGTAGKQKCARAVAMIGLALCLIALVGGESQAATRCVAHAVPDGGSVPLAQGSAVAISPITACSAALRACRDDLGSNVGKTGCKVVEARQTNARITVTAKPPQKRRDAAAPSGASCNVAACSRAYRTFRASDCTFQPNNGPRRVCTRTGGQPRNGAADTRIIPRGRSARQCNVAACRRAHRSFRASDCTYTNLFGFRLICRR